MLALSRAGADILPACPGFYHRPASVEDMVDFVVSRVVARVGVDIALVPRWGEAAEKEGEAREKAGGAGPLRRLRRHR
jgi:4-hydroxy-3-polyprenylbenzoate decarboxylase